MSDFGLRAAPGRDSAGAASAWPAIAIAAGILALAAGGAASAAPITWADPAGLCNGEAPCFATLAAAVANAGPPPAQVFLFPGTYPESVDLGTMGFAIGGGPGELALVSVDASGQPAPGAVVDPGASGGPGTGPAIRATGFPGPLAVDGLVLRSPDDDALSLVGGTGALLLARLDASDSAGGNGVVVEHATGDVRVEDSLAVLNLEAGFALSTGQGALSIEGSVAERNESHGFETLAASLSVVASRADANGGVGVLLQPLAAASTLVLQDVDAGSNDLTGIIAFPATPGTGFAAATVDGVEVIANLDLGVVVAAEQVTATGITARGNGAAGAAFAGRAVSISGAVVELNGEVGLGVATMDAGATFSLTGVTATANQIGVIVQPADSDVLGTGVLFGVVATGSQQTGIIVLAERLTAALVTAADNGDSGVLFLVLEALDATGVSATGNGGGGIGAGGLDPEIRIENSVATGNATGILVDGGRVRLEGCTANASGPLSGDPFDGVGFVVSADLLEAEDDLAVGNEVGWVFADLDTTTAEVPAGSGGSPAPGFSSIPALANPRVPRFAPGAGPAPGAPGGPAVPQGLSIRTSRTEGNLLASMQVALRPQGRLTVGCSDFVGNGPSGLELATDNIVDARANFWGAASGPTHPGNPGGTGDLVRDSAAGLAGTVLYAPFLAGPAGEGDCPVPAALDIPTLGPGGVALLALALAGLALAALRRRPSPP